MKNPIAIFNTGKRENGGEHWIGLVVAYDKKLIVFDSSGKKGFNKFFLTDDIKKFKKLCTFENLKPLSSNGIVDFLLLKSIYLNIINIEQFYQSSHRAFSTTL